MLGMIFFYIVILANIFVVYMAYGISGGDIDAILKVGQIMLVAMLVITWPGIAVLVKRMHDRNRSGWWVAMSYAFLFASGFLSNYAIDPDTGEVINKALFAVFIPVTIVALVLGLWLFVEVAFLRGTRGTNRYGPDPIAES